jgi:hypothetical protein
MQLRKALNKGIAGDLLHYVAPGETYQGKTFEQWNALIGEPPELEV